MKALRWYWILHGLFVLSLVLSGWMRTEAQTLTWLGTLPGNNPSYAFALSTDGSVVVGMAHNASNHWRAFRWTSGGGMQDLGTLSGGSWSYAYGVSADGSTVVGWADNASGQQRAFRWTSGGGMQDLGTLPGYNQFLAIGASANGSVVVGRADNPSYTAAFRWTAIGGMEDLNFSYASLLANGSWLYGAYSISPNGRYIVGNGWNAATQRYEAYLLDTLTIPEPASWLLFGVGLTCFMRRRRR